MTNNERAMILADVELAARRAMDKVGGPAQFALREFADNLATKILALYEATPKEPKL